MVEGRSLSVEEVAIVESSRVGSSRSVVRAVTFDCMVDRERVICVSGVVRVIDVFDSERVVSVVCTVGKVAVAVFEARFVDDCVFRVVFGVSPETSVVFFAVVIFVASVRPVVFGGKVSGVVTVLSGVEERDSVSTSEEGE